MNKYLSKRLISLVLALVLCLSLVAPAGAVGAGGKSVSFEKVDNSEVPAFNSDRAVASKAETPLYRDTDVVRVSIVLKEKSTIEKGFSIENIAENASAMAYRQSLQAEQETVTASIERVTGEPLDVAWNLTLAANLISANVAYGDIDDIKALPGVEDVVVETRYEPMVVGVEETDPNMATSSDQIGSGAAWAAGYTGEGSKIAIIDTGTDTDHQSFDADAFLYAVGEDADLMDASDIAAVLDKLNIAKFVKDADELYLNAKLPFAFNYVDEDFNITHDNDTQGEHGSHVAGIATANRFIPNGEGGYDDAISTVHTQGVAPDAQLITMKVFGKGGGAYDSDYMAAIEDAVVLGADSINLSLGSGNPGFSYSTTYQHVLDSLTEAGAVVCISAGNSGAWQDNTIYGYLYSDGVSMQTDGSPGSFTNAFTVASVDNSGNTGNFLNFGEDLSAVSFTETSGYTNAPIASLDSDGNGAEYDFVLFNNTGKDGSGNNLLTPYAEICEGKVVMVYRGTSSFYEKHEAAAEVGAAACIVVNNQAGTINMDLSSSSATIPCISITQASGESIKKLSTTQAVTDEDGAVLYYTGKVIISADVQHVQGTVTEGYAAYTMSSYTSWGIPGSLELKPEITAPGGNIYSVNGAVPGGKAYENMSGTSMASPQVAGMVAVLAQYIRENKLVEKTGKSARFLAQSLLMSTAMPNWDMENDYMSNGYYSSILQQGAGIANVNSAIRAHSYIEMAEGANAGAADGKVKAELGDDPNREGVYYVDYTIHNLLSTPATYQLFTDVFTQGMFMAQTYTGLDILLDTMTAQLDGAVVTYYVNGNKLDDTLITEDGEYTMADVQVILDLSAGKIADLTDAQKIKYDLDGDEKVTTYDAHLLLAMLEDSEDGFFGVPVPANGSVDITVEIDVTDCFEDGESAYIEAYTFASETSSEEGELGTEHSIPVLGYFGSWTDSSMYDVGTLADYWYETEERYPYLVNETELFTNYLTVKYPGDSGEYYYFGNPLTDDDEYLPERNAFNSDGIINKFYATVIRNAAASKVEITDVNTDEVYYSEALGSVYGAYYYSNGSAWRNTQSSFTVGWQGTDLEGKKLAEDTEVNISLILAPEYYVDYENGGKTDWDALEDGAYMTVRTAIDNTAPEMTGLYIELDGKTLTVEAADNRYLATVALYQRGVDKEVDFIAPNQALEDKGKSGKYQFDTEALEDGADMYIQLTDYAMNQSTYKFVFKGENEPQNPTSITLPATATVVKGTSIILTPSYEPWLANEGVKWSSADEDIAVVDENGKVTGIATGSTTITATSSYDETVSATCTVTVKAYEVTITGALQDAEGNPQLFTWDLDADKTWKKTVDIKNDINAVTFDFLHKNGPMFQMDTSGYLHKVDVTTGETLESSVAAADFGAPVDDMEYAGLTSMTSQQDVLVGVYGYYFLYSMPGMDNTFSYGWNMASYLSMYLGASSFTAVAWAGYDSQGRDVFFCLTDSGDFWVMMPNFTTGSAGLNYYYTDLELDFPGYDGAYYCSMVMGDDGNFYLSYFNGSTNQIYVLEGEDIYEDGKYYDTVYHATLLGDVGDAVWPAALLAVTSNEDETEEGDATERLLEIEAIDEIAEAEQIVLPAPQPETVGGLNAVKGNAEIQGVEDSGVTTKAPTVTVTINESVAVTNGVYAVHYDPAVLKFEKCTSLLDHVSFCNDAEAGTVKFAFADADEIAADNTLATLKFSYVNENYVDSKITIETVERNDGFEGDDDTSIELPFEDEPNGHDWDDATCTAPKTCKTCGATEGEANGHTEAIDAAVAPTCTETGLTEGKHCSVCGEVLVAQEVIPATGHSFVNNTCIFCGATLPGGGSGSGSGSGSPQNKFPFTDVKKSDDAYQAIKYLYDNDIMVGTSATTFSPDMTLDRGMVATILYRIDGEPKADFKGVFSDVSSDLYCAKAVEWAAANGIALGCPDGTFKPYEYVTLEQLAAFLSRYAEYKGIEVYDAALSDTANVSDWARANVAWMFAEGIFTAEQAENAVRNATRAEVAVAMYTYITKIAE